jgi:hypothetical protein
MRFSAESRYTRTWGMNNHWPDAPAPATSVWGTNSLLQYRFVSILRARLNVHFPLPGFFLA